MISNKYASLVQLLKNERRPRKQLLAIQNEKLRRLMHRAYERIPHYRDSFDQSGIRPEDIHTAADLATLPILRKQDLMNDTDRFRDPSLPQSRYIDKSTSGSSGFPFRFTVDTEFDQFCKAQFLRPYFSLGRGLFDRTLRISSNPAPPQRWFNRLGLLRQDVVMSDLSGAELLEHYRRLSPDVVMGYPSTVTVLADAVIDSGLPVQAPKIIFTDSELLTDFARNKIQAAFAAPIFDVYGTMETDNIAWQCSDGSHYHYAADCVILETVVDGENTALDEPGELVCTVLDNLAAPLIRYHIGDIVTLSSSSCDCGRTLPLISSIEGRSTDQLTLPDGSRLSTMSLLRTFKSLDDFITQFQIVQTDLNHFDVFVATNLTPSDAQRGRVTDLIRAIHPSAEVTVHPVAKIDVVGTGKLRPFISQLEQR